MQQKQENSLGKIWLKIILGSIVLAPFCLLLFATALLASIGRFFLPILATIWFMAEDWLIVMLLLLLWMLSLAICRTSFYRREFAELFR